MNGVKIAQPLWFKGMPIEKIQAIINDGHDYLIVDNKTLYDSPYGKKITTSVENAVSLLSNKDVIDLLLRNAGTGLYVSNKPYCA